MKEMKEVEEYEKRRSRNIFSKLDFMHRKNIVYVNSAPLPDCYVLQMDENDDRYQPNRDKAIANEMAVLKKDVEERSLLDTIRYGPPPQKNGPITYTSKPGKSHIIYFPMYSGEVFLVSSDGKRTAFRVGVNGQTGSVFGQQPPSSFFFFFSSMKSK